MVKLFHHNALQFLGDLLFRRINASLGKQPAQIEVLGL
jgi:hypothetical protein